MIEDLLAMQYLALAFAAVLALLWIIFESSRRRPEKPQEKSRIFACGTEATPGELNVPSEGYFDYMKKLFVTEPLARAHSGRLSTYVIWILTGLAVIMAVMVMLW
jgi:hypothetical protein